jgi:hypothetical protein
MRGAILLWAALLSVAYAQGQTAKLAERHARIQVLFKEEAHAEVVREIERQFNEAVGTTWQDSLYGYVPLHGRSIWRLSNAQAAMDAAERLLQQARKADKDAGREVKTLIDLGDLYYDIGLPREPAYDPCGSFEQSEPCIGYGIRRYRRSVACSSVARSCPRGTWALKATAFHPAGHHPHDHGRLLAAHGPIQRCGTIL